MSVGSGLNSSGAGGMNYGALLDKVKGFTNAVSYRNKFLELSTKSLRNFDKLGKFVNEIHHIVGQGWGNAARFGNELINNPGNLIRLPKAFHGQIFELYGQRLENA